MFQESDKVPSVRAGRQRVEVHLISPSTLGKRRRVNGYKEISWVKLGELRDVDRGVRRAGGRAGGGV